MSYVSSTISGVLAEEVEDTMNDERPSDPRQPKIADMEDGLRQRAAVVALLRLKGASWTEVGATVLARGGAVGLLEERLSEDGALFTLDRSSAELIETAAVDIARWAAEGTGVHCCLDVSYPEQLRDIHQVPPVIFTRGALIPDVGGIAVVGTREASPRGIEIATALSSGLANAGVTVVSGLAAGIDTAAHSAALAAGGRTVAVIGTGINNAYPAQNARLQERIAHEGLLVSQFWPDAPPTRTSFPMRNAVMSGYAAATVVVEAAYRSGARMQARLALEHGRPVVLLQSLMDHDWARSYAERPGVYVVSGISDLLDVVRDLTSQRITSAEVLSELSNVAGG
jgi:DNA processing protein